MAFKTAKQQLCDLYNAANLTLPFPLTETDFTCGTRSAITPEGDSLANFAVSITALDESPHFINGITLRYRRLPVGFESKYVEGGHAKWADDAYALANFNADFQRQWRNDELTLNEGDENGQFTLERTTVGDEMEVVFTLRNHLKFIDTVVTYTIKDVVEKTDLSTTNGELDGFSSVVTPD